MKAYTKYFRASVAALAGVALGVGAQTGEKTNTESSQAVAPANDTQATESATPNPSPAVDNRAQGKTAQPKVWLSSETGAILKMAEAGIDNSVIKAYVENSKTASPPTADEIIYLRERGLPTEVITAYIQRGRQLQEQAMQAGQGVGGPGPATPSVVPGLPPPGYAPVAPAPSPTYAYSYPSPGYTYSDYPAYDYGSPYYYGGYPYYWGYSGYSFFPGFSFGFFPYRYYRGFSGRFDRAFVQPRGFAGRPVGYAGGFAYRSGSPFPPPIRLGFGAVGGVGGGSPGVHRIAGGMGGGRAFGGGGRGGGGRR